MEFDNEITSKQNKITWRQKVEQPVVKRDNQTPYDRKTGNI